MNVNQHDLHQYEHSAVLKIVKQDFLEGRWPSGCERCRIEEDNGVRSKRQLDHYRWREHYQRYDLDSLSLLTASVAFGNTCNLTCITCGPTSSSRWQREYQALHGKNVAPNHFYRQGFVDELLSRSQSIIHLDIPGGEPFLSGVEQQRELLCRLIEQGRAGEIALHYTTNATIWPDKNWWDLWQHFQEIDMQLSIDGTGSRFEYIRYPADWKIVSHHVRQYVETQKQIPNFRLSVSHTVSAYNIYYLPEFLDWAEAQGLPRPWLGRVHDPAYMRPSIWPVLAKKSIIERLQCGDQDAQIWASLISNTDDSEHFSLFCQRLSWHDRYRGLNFAQTFPELAVFLEK